jgi:DNA-directed RNA polymerase subunit omega
MKPALSKLVRMRPMTRPIGKKAALAHRAPRPLTTGRQPGNAPAWHRSNRVPREWIAQVVRRPERYMSKLSRFAFSVPKADRNQHENNQPRRCRNGSAHRKRHPAMRDDYLKNALKVVEDPTILVNVVSRRVKQLRRGSRPLVESLEKLTAEDTALREIIEGKIGYELATPEMLARL